jgi:hypothetical protein
MQSNDMAMRVDQHMGMVLHHLQDEARQLAPHVVRPIGAY